MRNRNRGFITLVQVGAFILTISLSQKLGAQGAHTTTDAEGNAITTEPSNEYGEGGTHITVSDKNMRVVRDIYKDKCGRYREFYYWRNNQGKRDYFDEKGTVDGPKQVTEVTEGNGGVRYEDYHGDHLARDDGKARVEKLKKTPSAPCDKVAVEPGPPEKPKDRPNPLGGILQGLSIGIGGGRTVSHDDHKGDHRVSDHKRTSSTTSSKKTVTAGCKCHPCTCSPCRCH